ncbi:MAG: V4R domain-containing protein [Promethearchaeota archaeon]
MFKKLKKELQINIDEKEGLLYLGEKSKELRLLMLRPIDIIEISEFAGVNAEDILIWVGKSLGKMYIEKIFPQKNWSNENSSTIKEIILTFLETLQLCGFGFIYAIFKKNHVLINIEDPLSYEEKENIMAKNICLLYQGIFNGMFETLGIEVDSEEIECVLKGDDKCVFKCDLLVVEFGDEDIDADMDQEAVSDFLSTL